MTSKTKSAPLPPVMPDLEIGQGDDDDIGDDHQDENHLMTILQKLKTAKRTLDSSRQKKKAKQLIEQSSARYVAESEELINKHNKRWAAKFGNIQQRTKKLKTTAEEKLKGWNESNGECEKRLNLHRVSIQNTLQSMNDLEKECKKTKLANDENTKAEINRIRIQVCDKLQQVQNLLIKAHSRSMKDDKFTKIIKSFITSF